MKEKTVFAERLRRVRVSRNLTQRELGEKVGLSQQAIPQIETGSNKPSIDTLLKLSKALEVSADYLLGLTDEASPYKTGGAA